MVLLLSKLPPSLLLFQAKGMPCRSGRLSPPWHSAETQHGRMRGAGGYWEPCKFCSLTNWHQAGTVGCMSRPVQPLASHVSVRSHFIFCSLHQKLFRAEVLPQPSPMMTRTRRPVTSHSHNSPVPPSAGALSSLWVLPSGLFSALFCFKGLCSASLPPRVSHCRVARQPAGTRALLETHAQGQRTGTGNSEISCNVSPLFSVDLCGVSTMGDRISNCIGFA